MSQQLACANMQYLSPAHLPGLRAGQHAASTNCTQTKCTPCCCPIHRPGTSAADPSTCSRPCLPFGLRQRQMRRCHHTSRHTLQPRPRRRRSSTCISLDRRSSTAKPLQA